MANTIEYNIKYNITIAERLNKYYYKYEYVDIVSRNASIL